jgi:hypothetical protein
LWIAKQVNFYVMFCCCCFFPSCSCLFFAFVIIITLREQSRAEQIMHTSYMYMYVTYIYMYVCTYVQRGDNIFASGYLQIQYICTYICDGNMENINFSTYFLLSLAAAVDHRAIGPVCLWPLRVRMMLFNLSCNRKIGWYAKWKHNYCHYTGITCKLQILENEIIKRRQRRRRSGNKLTLM